ncbi:TonB-dependent receptor [candidate division KSB1 bacterium]|nr:TonB-dependent receptor [candidate division KSB1 bacterium]
MKNFIILPILLCFSFPVFSAGVTGSIRGTITDAASADPMPGVNVMIPGTVLGTTTNLKGEYTISSLPPGSYRLRASMIGYKNAVADQLVVRAGETTLHNFAMQETVIETTEIMVTANKRRQRIQDTPNSIGIFTSKDFEQRNERWLDELLQYASGVNFIDQQVNIRGSSGYNYGAGSRVLLLVDGVPVMPGDSGDIKWSVVPATQVDHVEIIKGAGSALYGGSALGGVINVITKSASAQPATHIRFSAGVYDKPAYSEWQWTDRTLHFDNFDIDHNRRIGSSEIFVSMGRIQSTGFNENGFQTRYNGAAKFHTQLSGTQTLTTSAHYEGGKNGSPLLWRSQRQALEVSPVAIGDYVRSDKTGINVFHHWVANKNFGLKTRLSYFHNFWKNLYHDNISASNANRYGLEIQSDYQLSEHNVLTIGTEESWDQVDSDLVGNHDQYVISLYAQNERHLNRDLLLTLGMRYDYQNVDIGFSDSELSPKIGLVWHTKPYITFRASSGRGFRAASMSERFSDSMYSGLRVIPNENLHSETAWSHEVGFVVIPHPNLFLDVAGFISDYWDLIEPEADENNVVQFTNITRARISGVETNLKISPWIKGLSMNIGYTFMDPRDLDLDTVLGYRPKHLFTGSATWQFGLVEVGVDYLYVSRIEQFKVYPNDERVAQKILNGRMALNWRGYTLSLNANNIMNHNHIQRERILMPIRNFVATLSATF